MANFELCIGFMIDSGFPKQESVDSYGGMTYLHFYGAWSMES
jgi:hypothetical protein